MTARPLTFESFDGSTPRRASPRPAAEREPARGRRFRPAAPEAPDGFAEAAPPREPVADVEATPAEPPAPPPVDRAEHDAEIARVRGEARAEGYADGVAAAEAAGASEMRMLLAELGESLADLSHVAAERETAARRAARELGEALLISVAPELARAGLAAEVAAAAADALRPEAGPPEIRIRVAPDQAEALGRALRDAGLSAPVEADPELGDLHARLDWADGADLIDLEAAIGAARAALSRHLDPVEADDRMTAHG